MDGNFGSWSTRPSVRRARPIAISLSSEDARTAADRRAGRRWLLGRDRYEDECSLDRQHTIQSERIWRRPKQVLSSLPAVHQGLRGLWVRVPWGATEAPSRSRTAGFGGADDLWDASGDDSPPPTGRTKSGLAGSNAGTYPCSRPTTQVTPPASLRRASFPADLPSSAQAPFSAAEPSRVVAFVPHSYNSSATQARRFQQHGPSHILQFPL